MIPRPHKYGAKKVECDGYKFDSMAEAKFYGELKLRECAGAALERDGGREGNPIVRALRDRRPEKGAPDLRNVWLVVWDSLGKETRRPLFRKHRL